MKAEKLAKAKEIIIYISSDGEKKCIFKFK